SALPTRIAWLRSGSATPTSSTFESSDRTRAWLKPMMPTPTTPTRTEPSSRDSSRFSADDIGSNYPSLAQIPTMAPGGTRTPPRRTRLTNHVNGLQGGLLRRRAARTRHPQRQSGRLRVVGKGLHAVERELLRGLRAERRELL